MRNSTPILYITKEECCGCHSCYAICPTGAIHMRPDVEGFLYPNINETLCVGCHMCIQVCPFKTDVVDKYNEERFIDFSKKREV